MKEDSQKVNVPIMEFICLHQNMKKGDQEEFKKSTNMKMRKVHRLVGKES